MKYHLEFDRESDEKLYLQLYNIIKYEILNNKLKESEKLPSIRQTAMKFKVNLNTVIQAYDLLESENYITKVVGKGCFVSNKNNVITNEENKPILNNFYEGQIKCVDNINFAKGTLSPDYFPFDLYKRFANEIFDANNPGIFEYQNVQGLDSLRKVVADSFEKNDIFTDSEEIIITSGTQQSLNTIINFFHQKNRPNIVVANATYPNALNLFKKNCNIYTINQKKDGWDLEEFEALLKTVNISFIYEVFNFQNPTGITWSDEKKQKIVELAEKYNFYIVEDDSFADFYFGDDRPVPVKSFDKWNSEKVFYLKTFSKIIMPGIETAMLICPKKYLKQLILIKHSLGTTTTGFNQKILENFLKSEEFKIHSEKIRNILKEKQEYLLKKLIRIREIEVLFKPKGGFFLWVSLSHKIDLELFIELCKSSNLNMLNSSIFFSEQWEKNKFRLSFSSLTLEEIEAGVLILKAILEKSTINE